MDDFPEITGIICTHNRARYLERCIRSLLEQSLDARCCEILVVDNGSTDSTKAICDKFAERPNFRYVYEPVPGLSRARNTGWKQARGKYVGYIDDDAYVDTRWFEKALESFHGSSPEPEWVGGPVRLDWEVPPPSWLTENYYGALGWVDWGETPRFLTRDGEWLVGCNSLFQKKILERLGGFDTRLGRKKKLLLSGEEVQLQHRLRAIDGRLFYHPGVCIFHAVPEERTQPSFFYRRYYWGGITDYIMAKTLEHVPHAPLEQEEQEGSRIMRLLRHCLQATGSVSSDKRIQSRIYLSYVAGRLVAMVRFGWRGKDLEPV